MYKVQKTERRSANWTGGILCRNCSLKDVVQGELIII